MPLPFNKTQDLKLLKLVKENRILYNNKHSKYSDFDSREVVWQKIGDSLNRPAQVCKSRWVNIRDMMRRKIRDRLRNPHQRTYNYKYEDEMSFMLPFFREPNASEYAVYEDEDNEDQDMPSEIFVDESGNFVTHEREIKPIIRGGKSTDDSFDCFQDLSQLNSTDPLDVFLITIGSTLKKFSPYYLNQAKSKIFQVVQDYELQQIVSQDDQAGTSDGNR